MNYKYVYHVKNDDSIAYLKWTIWNTLCKSIEVQSNRKTMDNKIKNQ